MRPSKTAAAIALAPAQDSRYKVQVLDRTFAILEALSNKKGQSGVAALAQELGLHKSTVHRLLVVLERNRFVERSESGRYRLGWRLFELGMSAVSNLDLYERAKPFVSRLMHETGETAHLGVLRLGSIVSLVSQESDRSMRTPATVGRRSPLHCTSLGKAILAFLPPDKMEAAVAAQEFSQHTSKTIVSHDRLRSELALVRKRGYAIDNEEFEEGLRCVGAPVFGHSGEVAAAVSIAGPAYRVGGANLEKLARLVMSTANELSQSLGFRRQ
jgi:DNA-binding IclR family transcriptional regulator